MTRGFVRRTKRRPSVEVATAFVATMVIAASLAMSGVGSVSAQTSRAVTATPNEQLVDGQYVDLAWSGFEPSGAVRARMCPADADAVDDCTRDSASGLLAGDSRAVRTGSNGIGSTPFIVKAGEVDAMREGVKFACDTEHPCRIIVFELDADQVEKAFADAAFVPLVYALSTIPCPESQPRVAGSGATTARSAVVQWQAETCRPPLSLNVSYATSNSINGKDAFVKGVTDADFAVSGIALTDPERQQLAARGVQPMHIPVALGGLALVYNLWFDLNGDGTKEQVRDLQLRPETLARIMQGRILNWADPRISGNPDSDNPEHTFTSLPIRAVGRADNSAATWWLSSWFVATAREAWEEGGDSFKGGATAIFPAGNGVALNTGSDAVARQIRTFPGEQAEGHIPLTGLVGYVYRSEALKLGLPVAKLENEAGKFVEPSDESILAGLRAGTISDEGVYTPNFNNTDPQAYPLTVVSYAIAPAGGEGGLDYAHETVLQKFLEYAITAGQDDAARRGFVKLPDELSKFSRASVVKVSQAPQAAATPTPQASVPTTAAAAPVAVVESQPLPGPGGTVAQGSTSRTIQTGGAAPAASAPAPARAPAAPVQRAVSGVIRLLGGASPPVTVPNLVGVGLMALIASRVIAVMHMRNRRRRPHAGPPARSSSASGEVHP